MKYISYLLLSLFIVLAACTPEQKVLSKEEVDKEHEAIIKVIKAYNKAMDEKNFYALTETLAGDVVFFGTDSAEVINTFADFKEKIKAQWKKFDKMIYGEMLDISIQMDPGNPKLASIIFGIPQTITIGDKTATLFMRMNRTLKKERGKWVIVSGVVGTASHKQILLLEEMLKAKLESVTGEDMPKE
ncbi:MAG: nuclear transport factor 2 family protein [Candidatus Kapabacteria bacterium]|jgi:ketosteroid isomerase-like protein|nr:nuclear transport factor 2 family protein [Candidatus Kapabacteria bacterium]